MNDLPPQEISPPNPILLLIITPLFCILLGLFGFLLHRYLALMGRGLATLICCTPFIWLIISALRPAHPDRACPGCAAEALVLLDPQQESGVRCLRCSFRDPELRLPYMKDIMNDPDIAREAGYELDAFGFAHNPETDAKQKSAS